MKNVENEWFARDTSKKIRAVKRAQGMSGRPLTSHAPYGYIMGEDGHFVVDPETWERVQQLRAHRRRPNRFDEMGLFSGLLVCADCGAILYQQRYENETRKQDCYLCGSYKKRTKVCTSHFIRTDTLTQAVTENLRQVTQYALKHESRFVRQVADKSERERLREATAMKKNWTNRSAGLPI